MSLLQALREQCRKRRRALTAIVSVAVSAALAVVIAGRWAEFEKAITAAPAGIVVAGVALQVLALLSRSEAWHVCVQVALRGLRSRHSPAGVGRLAVWTALSELPAARRKVVELAYFGGLSYVQIGRAFGVPSAA